MRVAHTKGWVYFLPNLLTLLRIFLCVLLLVVMLHREFFYEILQSFFWTQIDKIWVNYLACAIFCMAGLTDFLDGFIARRYEVVSTFGEVFDPLADKLLILSAFLGLLVWGSVNVWAVFIILGREFFITGLRVVAVSKGLNIAASIWGKYKTGTQIFAIILLLIDFNTLGMLVLWLAVIITLYSGYEYAKAYLLAPNARN